MFEYKVKYYRKFFSNQDTIQLNGKCYIEKWPKDKIFGYKLRINEFVTNRDRIYDLKNIFVISHKKKTVLIDDPHKNNEGFITTNIAGDLIFKILCSKKPFQRSLYDQTIK